MRSPRVLPKRRSIEASVLPSDTHSILRKLDSHLIEVLKRGDIRLIASEWLLQQSDDFRMLRRQELEELERADQSPLLRPEEAVALIQGSIRSTGVLSYGEHEHDLTPSQVWLTHGVRIRASSIASSSLAVIPPAALSSAPCRLALRVGSRPRWRASEGATLCDQAKSPYCCHILGVSRPWTLEYRVPVLTVDHLSSPACDSFASLYQRGPREGRTTDEQAAFERALGVMGDLYASAVGTVVLQVGHASCVLTLYPSPATVRSECSWLDLRR